jgi:hypothetical protein
MTFSFRGSAIDVASSSQISRDSCLARREADGGVRSHIRTGLHWKFPVNTEKSEIRAFSAHFGRSKPLRRSGFLSDSPIQLTGKIRPRTGNQKTMLRIPRSYRLGRAEAEFPLSL